MINGSYMIAGLVLSANLGNFHPQKMKYLNSLADLNLAQLIHHKITELQPDIILFQEIGTFMDTVLDAEYEYIGTHDTIAVKKSFGSIVPKSFKSHTFHFKKSPNDPVYPNEKDQKAVEEHKLQLAKEPYNGDPNTPYGPPADFDIIWATIETLAGERFMAASVHVTSAPWNNKIRSKEIQEWVLEEFIPLAQSQVEGKMLIAGDFNQDELRQKGSSSVKIRELLSVPGMQDAAQNNREITTNYPRRFNYRLDHLLGTAQFTNYSVQQSLTQEDLKNFQALHRRTWWMYLDHKNVSAQFKFQ
jgi:hypothetical protein